LDNSFSDNTVVVGDQNAYHMGSFLEFLSFYSCLAPTERCEIGHEPMVLIFELEGLGMPLETA
jgi:hypothetical protein